MCGVSDDRCTGFSIVRRLFGSGVVGLCVPVLSSFVAMPGLCCFLRVTRNGHLNRPPREAEQRGTSRTCPAS